MPAEEEVVAGSRRLVSILQDVIESLEKFLTHLDAAGHDAVSQL